MLVFLKGRVNRCLRGGGVRERVDRHGGREVYGGEMTGVWKVQGEGLTCICVWGVKRMG